MQKLYLIVELVLQEDLFIDFKFQYLIDNCETLCCDAINQDTSKKGL